MVFLKYFQYNSVVILSYFFISLLILILSKFNKKFKNIFTSSRGSIFNPLTYIRMFTHVLGHDNFMHFRNNFIYILLIGPMIEEKYGSINLLKMILITSFLTSIFNMIFSNKKILGSSGISFMLILLSSLVNIQNGEIPITLILIFMFYVVTEIFESIFKNDNISHLSHIIGAISGIIFGYYYL